jgi:hypothetical protein
MVMNATLVGQLMFLLLLFVWFVVPTLIVARSRRAPPASRPLWVLVALVGSWLGLLAYFLATPKSSDAQSN